MKKQSFSIDTRVTEDNFINPVQYNDGLQRTNPDPYVIRFAGDYYCYSTGIEGVKVSRSKDFKCWEYLDYALCEQDYKEYWAPCVIYDNGLFYMYYSSSKVEGSSHHSEYLKLAVATKPEGPFKFEKVFFDKFSIDPHVVKVDGELYLYYSTNDYAGQENQCPGTSVLVDRMKNYKTLEGNPVQAVSPTLKEEVFMENRYGDGRDWYTIEGGFYLKNNNQHYLMYSGSAFTNETYFLGYSIAKGKGDHRKLKWKKYPDDQTYKPLISKNEKVEGTGHNSVVIGPDLQTYFVVYHGRDRSMAYDGSIEQREMFIDELCFEDGIMKTLAPTIGEKVTYSLPFYKNQNTNIDAIGEIEMAKRNIIGEVTWGYDGSGSYGLQFMGENKEISYELVLDSKLNRMVLFKYSKDYRELIESRSLSNTYNHTVPHTMKFVLDTKVSKFEMENENFVIQLNSLNCSSIKLTGDVSTLNVIDITLAQAR